MRGPARRMILAQGREYAVRNTATGSSGGRDTPSYSDAGAIRGVLEQRGMPRTVKASDGTGIQTDLEIRAVKSGDVILRGAGDPDGYPTHLLHPSGETYEVVAVFPEDSGVSVLSVVGT